MRVVARWIRIWIGIVLIALLYRTAMKNNIRVEESSGIATVILQKQISITEADEIQSAEFSTEEPMEINCWGEIGETTLESRINEHKAAASLVLTGGKTELLVPESEVLSWKNDGCFIDFSTALELFGTEQAIGQTIWCRDRIYTVCGTFASVQKVMLCHAQKGDGDILTTISCRIPPKGSSAAYIDSFMMRHGLTGKYADFTFLGYMSHDLLLLFPVCLIIRMIRILVNAGAGESKRMQRIIYLMVFLMLSAAVVFVGINFRIPADMIPTVWSDFSFWDKWWKVQRENLLYIFQTAQGEAQLSLLWSFFCSIACSTGAAVCTFLFF